MTRQLIGYSSKGPTVFRNVRKDGEGFPLLLLADGETKTLKLELAQMLESGETLSSATVAGSGVSASISNTTTAATLTLSGSGSWGEATVTLTLSSGEIIVTTIRVRQPMSGYDPTEIAYVA